MSTAPGNQAYGKDIRIGPSFMFWNPGFVDGLIVFDNQFTGTCPDPRNQFLKKLFWPRKYYCYFGDTDKGGIPYAIKESEEDQYEPGANGISAYSVEQESVIMTPQLNWNDNPKVKNLIGILTETGSEDSQAGGGIGTRKEGSLLIINSNLQNPDPSRQAIAEIVFFYRVKISTSGGNFTVFSPLKPKFTSMVGLDKLGNALPPPNQYWRKYVNPMFPNTFINPDGSAIIPDNNIESPLFFFMGLIP